MESAGAMESAGVIGTAGVSGEVGVSGAVGAGTAQGRVRGIRDGEALRFLGVPFAESPLTTGRFAAPVPHGRWDGVRDALEYGATSPQPDRGITLIPEPIIPGDNELNLNVFTPDPGAAGLPVFVWIHGGGFFGGCNASPWYRGGPFARDGVVLVSVNYRLGAEGFLEVPGAAVNRAVRDWVRALEWVQENIAAFGGDPAKVTIGGQSAGGGACATLLGVPAARGLFRAAVCMSGTTKLSQTADGVRAVAAAMAQRLGVPDLNRAVLEQFSAEKILAAQEAVMGALMARGAEQDPAAVAGVLSSGIPLPFGPWTDGDVVAESPMQAARRGDVPLLIGNTANETSMAWLGADWITADMVRDGLTRAGVPAPQAAAYLDRPGRPCDIVGQAVTDRMFRAPAQHLAQTQSEAGGDAWIYDFRWSAPGGPLPGLAYHCLDVPFAFDNLGEPGAAEATGGAAPAELASALHAALVGFVTGGDPGWGRYESGKRKVMVFAEQSGVQEDPLQLERKAWPAG
jgi:para-nitrobenzyl esterase